MSAEHSGLIIPVADTRVSAIPTTRFGMEQFLGDITPRDVAKVVETTLLRPPAKHVGYTKATEDYLTLFLEPARSPATGNPDGIALSHELVRTNEPEIWAKLLETSMMRNTDVLMGIAATYPTVAPQDVPQTVSSNIALSNLKFYGRTMINLGMAAMHGKAYPHMIHDRAKPDGYVPDSTNNQYQTGLEASHLFGYPAASAEEVVDRLQFLFPADADTPQDIPAFVIAKRAQAFVQRQPDSTPPTVVCPARDLTGELYKAYGNVLGNETYRARLTDAITSK